MNEGSLALTEYILKWEEKIRLLLAFSAKKKKLQNNLICTQCHIFVTFSAMLSFFSFCSILPSFISKQQKRIFSNFEVSFQAYYKRKIKFPDGETTDVSQFSKTEMKKKFQETKTKNCDLANLEQKRTFKNHKNPDFAFLVANSHEIKTRLSKKKCQIKRS